MKREKEDLKRKVINEMCINQTLIKTKDSYAIAEGASDEEVQTAIIKRVAAELNEDLKEPFGKARVLGNPTDEIVNDYVNYGARIIQELCESLFVSVPNAANTIQMVKNGLEGRYK